MHLTKQDIRRIHIHNIIPKHSFFWLGNSKHPKVGSIAS